MKSKFEEDFWELHKKFEDFFESTSRRLTPGLFRLPLSNKWKPAVDVYETANEIIVLVDLAGVNKEEIEVTFDGDSLRIVGTRRDMTSTPKVRLHQMEIDFGNFERSVVIPAQVDKDNISAIYRRGFLQITLTKLRKGRDEKIEIITD
ncbi:MAG: Hsp20/alpha crystallin family protein [Candidatus Aminicenantes bacterium]|nr:Hsp20/alpha crystallin family protein [Candidatus Aminicenantes bacterium]MDH5714000.1 Hsp20/alpha crystallin family protein [Candidatus Aminicenantes bacterium]